MGFFNDFDHWAVGENLDLASWDSYPIGFVERFPFSEEEKNRWALTSHPASRRSIMISIARRQGPASG